jgi:hypothetical protein
MISWSSSFASSTPATSLKVTRFCWLLRSFARDLPNDKALLPPDCICRSMKIQIAMMNNSGAHVMSMGQMKLALDSSSTFATRGLPFTISRADLRRSFLAGSFDKATRYS